MILCLETTSKNCSVSLFDGSESILREERSDRYIHSEKLHLFIDEVHHLAGIQPTDLKAVAVSQGPGSYTGLRIGVATAKGICYALGIPLIALNSLEVLARLVAVDESDRIIPVMDARRMEVYSQVYASDFTPLREIRAEVISEDAFVEYRGTGVLHLVGDGAEKCLGLLGEDGFRYYTDLLPTAQIMGPVAYARFKSGQFEDVAYFEPYYLKDFQTTKPKGS